MDPAIALRQRSGPAPLSAVLTDQQISDCLSAARGMTRGATADSRPVFLFNLLLETGIKKAEAGRIKLDDIVPSDSQRATLHVKHHIRNVYKERRIELAPHLLELFDRYRQQYKPQEQIFECTTRNLQYILTDIGALRQGAVQAVVRGHALDDGGP